MFLILTFHDSISGCDPDTGTAKLKTIHFPDTTKGTAWSTRRPFLLVLSIHHRDIQPELKGAEAGADIFCDADDRGGQAAADLTGFSQSLACLLYTSDAADEL